MSSRQFSLSVVATAVLISCHSSMALAAITSTQEDASKKVDLKQVSEQSHYRHSEMPVAQAGLVVLPAAPFVVNSVVNRGAVNGIAIQQDGIFLAPAPYSANTPVQANLIMMESLNSSTMTSVGMGGQGAFGALNYQSVQISPKDVEAVVNLETSQDGDLTGGFVASGQSKDYGMLLAVDYQKSERDVGVSKDFDAQYSNADLLFKIAADSLVGARNPQRTEFSFQYINNDNDTGPVGLTLADANNQSDGRYFANSNDNEQGKRYRYVLAHEVKLGGQSSMFTDFYYQSYEQRVNHMQYVDGQLITPAMLQAIAAFEKAPTATGLLLGEAGQRNDLEGFGIQTRGESQYGAHKVVYSARYHHDKAEMRQGYQSWLYGQDFSFTADENFELNDYKDDATALTTAVETQLNYDQWYMTFGLGYENVSVSREVSLTYNELAKADFSDDGWMPSLEIGYRQPNWSMALSAKQAWTAASAGNLEQEAQQALQYQLAGEYRGDRLALSASGYYHDYKNQHLSCMWSMPCDVHMVSIQENINDISVYGVDAALNYQFDFDSFAIPVSANYLYAKAETEKAGCNDFICYGKDALLPWSPEHQAAISTGLIMGPFSLMFNALYQSELGYQTGTDENYSFGSQWKLDVAANYTFSHTHQLYVRVENALDEELIAQHTPLGVVGQAEMRTLFGYQGKF